MTVASAASAFLTLAAVRTRAPLVHSITNLVVTNLTANALLAFGASPAMVEGTDEVEEFARIASALVINTGTMTSERAAAMRLAAGAAREAGVPWVLDPVAAGAISYRTAVARDLLRLGPAVVRGNASEIMALAGERAAGRGVDSAHLAEAAHGAAARLALEWRTVVAVTGAVDHVTDGARVVSVANGVALMTRITGMGCTASALIGACVGAGVEPLAAAAHGLALLGLAAERGMGRARGPASLQVALIDELYLFGEAGVLEGIEIREGQGSALDPLGPEAPDPVP